MSGTRSCFQGKPGSKRSSLAGPPGGSIPGWMSASPRPADACPFPDRALANVLLLRVVVIYILSVYINLSAAALAALLQSACLLGSLGDFPTDGRPGAACRGNGPGRQVPAPCEQQQTPASRGGALQPGPVRQGRGAVRGLAWGAARGQPAQGRGRRPVAASETLSG